MSWRHVEAAGLLPIRRPPVKAVLLAIAHHTNDHSGKAWPGLERLALFTGLTKRAVQMAIKELEVLELLTVKRGSGRVPSVYTITLPGVSPISITDKVLPPEALGPGVNEVHPSKGGGTKGERGAPQGGQTFTSGVHEIHPNTKERERKDASDARASVFDEDWHPTEATIARIKQAEGLDDDEIERERQAFILKALAGEVPTKPDAAFRAWCNRLKSLNHAPKKAAPKKAKAEAPVIDAAHCRTMIERIEGSIDLYRKMGRDYEVRNDLTPKLNGWREKLAELEETERLTT